MKVNRFEDVIFGSSGNFKAKTAVEKQSLHRSDLMGNAQLLANNDVYHFVINFFLSFPLRFRL